MPKRLEGKSGQWKECNPSFGLTIHLYGAKIHGCQKSTKKRLLGSTRCSCFHPTPEADEFQHFRADGNRIVHGSPVRRYLDAYALRTSSVLALLDQIGARKPILP